MNNTAVLSPINRHSKKWTPLVDTFDDDDDDDDANNKEVEIIEIDTGEALAMLDR